MNEQYKLVELTEEELKAFREELTQLIEKHNVYFEPIPKFVREKVGIPFTVSCDFFVSKKVKIEEPKEENKENA